MKDMTLYHGSRGGIIGNIQPDSRIRCDFGQGFCMGTRQEQAKTLVYNDPMPVFYTVNFKLSNISDSKILTLADMDWAFYVLYNRGRLENIKNTPFYDKIVDMDKYEEYQKYVNNRKHESEQKIKTIKRQYRSEGKYLDQILDEYKSKN